jgi:DeoR family transcriptional regulator, lactose phosphotransferase system repressor
LKKDRQRRILEIVERSGNVEVEQLANTLAVSDMTIRRDLTELDELGFVELVIGVRGIDPVKGITSDNMKS